MAGGLRLKDMACSKCGEPLRQSKAAICCTGCGHIEDSGIEGTVKYERYADAREKLFAIVETLVRTNRIFQTGAGIILVTNFGLVPLDRQTAPLLKKMIWVVEWVQKDGEWKQTQRWLNAEEASGILELLNDDKEALAHLSELKISAPTTLLIPNVMGGLIPTKKDQLREGILTTKTEVKPENTGEWSRFLDMAPWEDDVSRLTYEAVCMSMVLPLEAGRYPLVVTAADGNEAGKTFLWQVLGWALGYDLVENKISGDSRGISLKRAVLSTAMRSRIILFDNETGTEAGWVSSSELSSLISADVLSDDALYRKGHDQVPNHHVFALTMNGGRVSEDLASRAVYVGLRADPDDPRRKMRGELPGGGSYWKRKDIRRAVLAEILWRTQQQWEGSKPWTGPVRRPEQWHALAARLVGQRIPEIPLPVRGMGLLIDDRKWPVLRNLIGEGATTKRLAEDIARSGGELRIRELSAAAKASPMALDTFLKRARNAGVPIRKDGELWITT